MDWAATRNENRFPSEVHLGKRFFDFLWKGEERPMILCIRPTKEGSHEYCKPLAFRRSHKSERCLDFCAGWNRSDCPSYPVPHFQCIYCTVPARRSGNRENYPETGNCGSEGILLHALF